MLTIQCSEHVFAPPAKVFAVLADPDQFSEAVPAIIRVEWIAGNKGEAGGRFRETRLMKGKEASTELEVVEVVPYERIRLVAESHGTIWDSVFYLTDKEGGTEIVLAMEAKTKNPFFGLMNRLASGMMEKFLAQDLAAVKVYCEQGRSGSVDRA